MKALIFIQKQLAVVTLCFLGVFFLFSSTTLFANEPVICKQEQSHFIESLANGRPLCSLTTKLLGNCPQTCSIKKEVAEQFKDISGVCFGLSSVWLYSKYLQFIHPEVYGTYTNHWFTSIMEHNIERSAWFNCDHIEEFALLVNRFQDSEYGSFSAFEQEMNRVNINDQKSKIEYSIAAMLNLDQLKQLLKEDIIREDKLIFIFSKIHTVAVFKHENIYYYFDSNMPCGDTKTTSTDVLAELIFKSDQLTNLYEEHTSFSLVELSFDEKPEVYPKQHEILDRVLGSNKSSKIISMGLQQASLIGCLESAHYFLNNEAIINGYDSLLGRSSLTMAAMHNQVKIVELLLEKNADPNLKPAPPKDYKMLAVRWLYGLEGDTTPLINAANRGHLEVVQLLLESYANPNDVDKNSHTALMHVAGAKLSYGMYDKGVRLSVTEDKRLKIVRLLLENGANPNLKDTYGKTALMIAKSSGYLEIVNELEGAVVRFSETEDNKEPAVFPNFLN